LQQTFYFGRLSTPTIHLILSARVCPDPRISLSPRRLRTSALSCGRTRIWTTLAAGPSTRTSTMPSGDYGPQLFLAAGRGSERPWPQAPLPEL